MEPRQLITNELAKELNLNYLNQRSPLITADMHKEDANAIWYSIEELERYISYLKRKSAEEGVALTGIRFYLGVYPNDRAIYGDKSGMTTIFLSPTKKPDGVVVPLAKAGETEYNVDALELRSLNYGNMGKPPRLEYGV